MYRRSYIAMKKSRRKEIVDTSKHVFYVKYIFSWKSCRLRNTYIHTYLLTYFLTPWNRVLLEKRTSFQLVKKFPAFRGTRRFVTAFTSACHLSPSWASSIQPVPPHPTSWRSILILSSHLCLGLLSGLFPSGFPTKTLYMHLLPPTRATYSAHLILLDFITRTILGEGYRFIKLLIMWFSPLTCYRIPLRPKYSPQLPILKHPQHTFLPHCQQPSLWNTFKKHGSARCAKEMVDLNISIMAPPWA